MKVKIAFTHEARPHTTHDVRENIFFESTEGVLPNTGEVVSIHGITHPEGSFVVGYRAFEINPETHEMYVTLGLSLEKFESDND